MTLALSSARVNAGSPSNGSNRSSSAFSQLQYGAAIGIGTIFGERKMLLDQPRFNLIELRARFRLSAARPVSAGQPTWAMSWAMSWATSLIRRAWRIVVAIRHRCELAQLSDQDDR